MLFFRTEEDKWNENGSPRNILRPVACEGNKTWKAASPIFYLLRGGGDAVFQSDDGVRLKNAEEIYLVATCG
jgi:hypothetical protein